MGMVHLRRWFLICLVLAAAAAASAQDGGRRIFEEQLRVELDQQQAAARQMGLDGGGWFSFNYFKSDDNANRESDLSEYDLRLWASFTLNGVHNFYIRGVTGYQDWRPDTSQSQFNDPLIERAFYKFDFNRLIRNQTGQNPPVGFTAQVGRDYYVFGTGLALAQTLDAVDISVNAGDWTNDRLDNPIYLKELHGTTQLGDTSGGMVNAELYVLREYGDGRQYLNVTGSGGGGVSVSPPASRRQTPHGSTL